MVTTDLSNFGETQREEAIEILKAYNESGLPEDFYDNEVLIHFNSRSGYVFLSNSEYEVAILCDGVLESFYTLPNGTEGVKDNLIQMYNDGEIEHEEEISFMKDKGWIK